MSEISKFTPVQKAIDLQNKKEVTPDKLREVADMYEKHFLKEMIKQMKSTVVEGNELFKKNNAEKIFQEQLDEQYAGEWNKQGSFGLSDMIYKQLTERYGNEAPGLSKPAGPVELNEKIKIETISAPDDASGKERKHLSLKIYPGESNQNQKVFSPWAGTLQSKELIEGETTAYRIKHDNGLESLISVRGAPSEETRNLSRGDFLRSGQEIGVTGKSSPLFWTVRLNEKVT